MQTPLVPRAALLSCLEGLPAPVDAKTLANFLGIPQQAQLLRMQLRRAARSKRTPIIELTVGHHAYYQVL